MSAMSSASAARDKRRQATAPRCPFRRRARGFKPDRRNMNELNQRPAAASALQCAPIGVVAQVSSGIPRQAGRDPVPAYRSQQVGKWRGAWQRRFATRRNDAALRAMSAGIGKQDRDRIARPRLDAELTSAPGEAKHQNDIRLQREQPRQVAIDGRVRRCKDVGRANDFGESRPAPAGESLDQSRAGIERRAGKRAEADQEDPHRVSARACRQFPRRPRWVPGARPRHRPRSAAGRP